MAGPNETDLDGKPRVFGGRIDMGAYEFQGMADLEITSEDVNFVPIPGEPCEPVTISATIRNIGIYKAQDVKVVFMDFDNIIGDVNIPIMLPGESNTVSIQRTWNEASFRLITVIVDPNNQITESEENNNSASKVYQIGEPRNMDAYMEVLIPAPSGFTEGTVASICGTASYKILITGQPDFVYPVKGGLVSAQVIDCNGIETKLFERFTDTSGRFTISFPVPCRAEDVFDVNVSVTDCSIIGKWSKTFHVYPPHMIQNDLWVDNITFDNETPDVNDTINITAKVTTKADNNDTIYNVPVSFYAYNLSLGTSYQIGSTQYIAEMPKDSNTIVSIIWKPQIEGQYSIRVILGPGYSDDNYGNNQTSRTITVGPFTISASPRYARRGQVVEITVDSRVTLPSDQLDSIDVNDSAGQPIPMKPGDPCHPLPTRWVYHTQQLPEATALGRATVVVSGTNGDGNSHNGYSYFNVVEVLPDLWLSSCDVNLSDVNPELGETITIGATIHASPSNLENVNDVPVTFYSTHGTGSKCQIGHTQYIEQIAPGGSGYASVAWTNAAEGYYVMEASLEPGFSDKDNGNNKDTRILFVGDLPFEAEFVVVNKIRRGRTIFDYECKVALKNLSPLYVENVALEVVDVPDNMIIVDPYVNDFPDIGADETVLSEDTCTFRVDRSEAIETALVDWKTTYSVIDTCQTMQQTSLSLIVLEPPLAGDITGEGIVDFIDLALLADQWLQPPGIPSADIAPGPDGDGIVNFLDFAELAENWMR